VAKKRKSKGMEIKIGRGRARYRGKWITWEEVEKEERAREEKGKVEARNKEKSRISSIPRREERKVRRVGENRKKN